MSVSMSTPLIIYKKIYTTPLSKKQKNRSVWSLLFSKENYNPLFTSYFPMEKNQLLPRLKEIFLKGDQNLKEQRRIVDDINYTLF